jgi:hypothetical protein
MKLPLHILLALSTAILPCRAEELALPDSLHPYNRFHEKAVRIQGLAWIQVSAKLDMVLLITPSAQIWLEPWTDGAAAEFQKWNGKLIEVSGILREGELSSHSEGEDKPTKERITYYRMSDFAIRGIDRVQEEITIKTEQAAPRNR